MTSEQNVLERLTVAGSPTAPRVVLFHGEGADGWYAGFAAFQAFGAEQGLYLKLRAGHPFLGLTGKPTAAEEAECQALAALCAGKEVYVLDLGVGSDALRGLAELARRLVVIDHHAAFDRDYDQTQSENVEIVYTPLHSAAYLAWHYWNPSGPTPQTVLYVEDRDLWKWALPLSRECSAAIAARPWTFENIAAQMHEWGCLVEEGRHILQLVRKEVQRTIAHAARSQLAGYHVPIVNATNFISEVGEALLGTVNLPQTGTGTGAQTQTGTGTGAAEAAPEPVPGPVPFVATYRVTPDGYWLWSLRSAPQANGAAAFDVGALARDLGGGGHVQAAGFKAPPHDPFMLARRGKKEEKPQRRRDAEQTPQKAEAKTERTVQR